MIIRRNVILKQFTTFQLGGPADYFCDAQSIEDLTRAISFARSKRLAVCILGGGSNVIVSDRGFRGMVVRVLNRGISIVRNTRTHALVRAASGEVWDRVVTYAISKSLWGIENLSTVPGWTGALAVQNVGCYGQQASDVIEYVDVLDRSRLTATTLTADQCRFGYRSSIFNASHRNRYVILATYLKLKKNGKPNVSYPQVQDYIRTRRIRKPSLRDMRRALITIRRRKFADVSSVGTTGSTFKNLHLTAKQYKRLYERMSKTQPASTMRQLASLKKRFSFNGKITIPTAFLIDSVCGLRGVSIGGAQVSPLQSLAIINPAFSATSSDVLKLIRRVRVSIYKVTGCVIEIEPELLGFTAAEMRNIKPNQ